MRPAGDALYASTVEPWSEVLTGRMGRSPGWDPLAFAVQEAHRRGLELHAWFNPFRASTPQMRSPVASRHVIRARPQWVRQYGRHRWMDPGEPAVRRHAIRVVLDVLRRYDVDGIHLDDYFYPYLENDRASGRVIQFPDAATYRRYRRSGGRLTRADWRRENVNTFVRELYQAIRREKPWVKFGVSPFGIWRPGHPPGVQGLDAYSEIYADARTWVRNGWLDYVVPQLYWSLDKPQQPYIPLMSWWAAQNSRGRHLWIGNYTDRVRNGDPRANWPAEEILQQVAHTRGPYGASGNVHFSMSVFMQNRDRIVERLTEQLYAEPALVPPSPWLDSEPPPAPRAALARGAPGLAVRLTPATGEPVRFWVVRTRDQAGWATAVVGAEERTVVVGRPGEPSPAAVAVSAVDRVGNESAPVILVLRRTLRWPTAPMSP